MARVDGAARAFRERVVVDRNAAAFAACHVLIVIEAERADMTDAAKLSSLVAAADALAGVFDDDEVASPRDIHDGVHVASCAPHVNGDDGPRAWADRGFDRLWIDRD